MAEPQLSRHLGFLGEDLLVAVDAPEGALTYLAAHGHTAEGLAAVALDLRQQEERASQDLTLNPSLGDAPLDETIDRLRGVRRDSTMITNLAIEMRVRGQGQAYSLRPARDPDKVIVQGRKALGWNRSAQKLLMLDATANQSIARTILTADLAHVLGLKVRRNVEIVQVRDKSFSKDALLWRAGRSEALRCEVSRLVKLLAHDHPGSVLVAATKEVRVKLTSRNDERKLERSEDWLGAEIAHFGNLRGADGWKDHQVGVVIGRELLPLEVAELDAMALHFDSPDPIVCVKPDEAGRTNYIQQARDYEMSDGTRRAGSTLSHPDLRVQALIEQRREAEILQTLDRLRLIHNKERKVVYLLSSAPIAGLPIDRLVTWRELVGDRRLNAAVDQCAARGEPALLLSAGKLAARFSELWPTVDAAKAWLRSTPVTEQLSKGGNAIRSIMEGKPPFETEPEVVAWRVVQFRPCGRAGGRPSRALVRFDADPAEATALALGVEPAGIAIIEPAGSSP